MSLKKLTELDLFNSFPSAYKNSIIKAMTGDLLLGHFTVSLEKISEGMGIIQRRYKYVSRPSVIEAVGSAEIIPVFDNGSIIPTSIPSWLIYNEKNRVVAVSNLSPYAKQGEKELDIDTKKLFGLLQSALVLMRIYHNENKLTNNVNLVKNLTHVYTRMFVRCLDRLYSLNLDPLQTDKVNYLVAKYFQIGVMGRADTPSTKGIAFGIIPNDTPKSIIERTDDEMIMEYDSLSSFVVSLAGTVDKIQHLTLRSLTEAWTKMFGPSALLAVESFHYFVVNVFWAATLSGVNSEVLINNLADKQVQASFLEFFRLTK